MIAQHRSAEVLAPPAEGQVTAVCTRSERSASIGKPPVEAIHLDEAGGILGDIHAGPGERQVALIALETLEELRGQVGRIDCGAMGENLVLAGVAPSALLPGARIEFASGAAIEVTHPRTPCVELNEVAPGLLRASVGRAGWFARVLRGGRVAGAERFRLRSP